MHQRFVGCSLAAALVSALSAAGSVPVDDTFAQRTVLSPGVMSVDDMLMGTPYPDTVLGVYDLFGGVYKIDDDGSPVGDGRASGLFQVALNGGTDINLGVTAYPDYDLIGDHDVSGAYVLHIAVYDFFGDLIDTIEQPGELSPGIVNSYSFSDFNWFQGNYDAWIDNTVAVNDVDFFEFTGLIPGTAYVAEVTGPEYLDTYMGLFDGVGNLLATDDDGGQLAFSRLLGTADAGGSLVYAVTGYGDLDFQGGHESVGAYTLGLKVAGDLDGDGFVGIADLNLVLGHWNQAVSPGDLTGDPSGDGFVGIADLNFVLGYWNAGTPPGDGASGVPESGTLCVLTGAVLCALRRRGF
ncbi:MAG: hypothetical protein R3C45_14530 [Phycisphaerales bacterium]